jgi:DNA polymerase (family 10)
MELGKAIEIDSYPDRQDLSVDLLREAKQEGCLIAIDTDAHHPWQLAFAEFGLAAALKAGIKADRIINLDDVEALKARFHF